MSDPAGADEHCGERRLDVGRLAALLRGEDPEAVARIVTAGAALLDAVRGLAGPTTASPTTAGPATDGGLTDGPATGGPATGGGLTDGSRDPGPTGAAPKVPRVQRIYLGD